ncbi:transporter [Micromonospora terminaliae]|uniref:Magnesium and cobalt transport protein CorA n=1 Tax=Micromonospora terminaliae TaxID=1914461 RepID=A0AAJ3DHD5_9ACTN|nr:magnesium and cobalt transport protein CorA [Micromonospora terminaliae]NES26464.1 magnesium and cobalt transport protein CorA [Micromonospora terminaliae]QGL50639.1 transporter [Micromonospora terminaliae]
MADNRFPAPAEGFGRRLDEHAADARPAEPERPAGLVDSGVYVDGVRRASPVSLADTYRCLQELDRAVAWIGLCRPSPDQIGSLAAEFQLPELAVEDAINAHQRPKLERYGDTLFVVLRAARYLDAREAVEFAELHLFLGPGFVITVRHGGTPDLAGVRRRLEAEPAVLALGPEAVLYAVLDRVVDGYAPVVAGLENDIDEIETEVFGGDPNASRRIYELSREVIQFQRAARPLLKVVDALAAGFDRYGTDEELRRRLRDVADHLTQVVERVDGFRHLLQNILTVNATLVSQAQNEEMRSLTAASFEQNEEIKRVSAWAAILFAPTLIGTVYGMNFAHMPELGWRFGYLFAIALMAAVCGALYLLFKRRGWL